jgi:hypothetical protein
MNETILTGISDAMAAPQGPDVVVLLPDDRANLVVRGVRGIFSGIEWLFGMAWLIVMLAVLATIPVLNLLSLGYLLTVSGRVAKSGRLRDGFVGVRKAAVLGRIVFFTLLFLWPIQFVSSLRDSAWLIDPDGAGARRWHFLIVVLTTLAVWHIVWAVIRGGRARHFLWPAPVRFVRWVATPNKYVTLRDAVCDFVFSLHLPAYFSLGLRGFLGTLAWLAGPVGVLILASRLPTGPGLLLSLLGAAGLAVVVLYLPFIQAHFAVENRMEALFEWREVRRLIAGAPLASWAALLVLLLFALPLFLLKIELTPREVAWLPALFFVVFMFPARLLTGWAVGRARKRQRPRHFVFRWAARLATLPVAFVYVLIVYLTQYLSWYGALSMLEQHAFLVPSPMLSL